MGKKSRKNDRKILVKSGVFVREKKWEPCLQIDRQQALTLENGFQTDSKASTLTFSVNRSSDIFFPSKSLKVFFVINIERLFGLNCKS